MSSSSDGSAMATGAAVNDALTPRMAAEAATAPTVYRADFVANAVKEKAGAPPTKLS